MQSTLSPLASPLDFTQSISHSFTTTVNREISSFLVKIVPYKRLAVLGVNNTGPSNVLLGFTNNHSYTDSALLNFMSYMDAVKGKGVSYLEQSKEQKLICCYNNDGEVFVGSLQLQRVTMDVVKGVSYLEQSKEQSFN
ncbi:hypothetical protein L6452_22875 [Arctium lappa]|uniref:Uncharacterized protein n=1 Tax=Arctium lappa TaxID=4217 RepID=A0ACB9B2A1_ARCLA|nr:hypothetical protein L6452_22875 [Arctium lappa]